MKPHTKPMGSHTQPAGPHTPSRDLRHLQYYTDFTMGRGSEHQRAFVERVKTAIDSDPRIAPMREATAGEVLMRRFSGLKRQPTEAELKEAEAEITARLKEVRSRPHPSEINLKVY